MLHCTTKQHFNFCEIEKKTKLFLNYQWTELFEDSLATQDG